MMLKRLTNMVYKPSKTLFKRQTPIMRSSFKLYHSSWSHVEKGPEDPILGIQELFLADKNPDKISLVVGAYRTNEGKPWILPSVKMAENIILSDTNYNHEYGKMSGNDNLCNAAKKLAFGNNNEVDSICSIQSLSGTGCLRVLFEFINLHYKDKSNMPTIHIPKQTWGAHRTILNHCDLKFKEYPYFDSDTFGLDYNNLLKYMESVPKNDIVLLHSVAHNPTGVDPDKTQWAGIADVIKKTGCMVLFDSAYQGFASGDCDRDAYSLRLFREKEIPLMLAQSFAKNMGLYGQRVGVASIQCKDAAESKIVHSQFKIIARGIYSNPPVYGGKIAEKILTDDKINKQWLNDIKTMSTRITDMRTALVNELKNVGSKHNWDHVNKQIGMFSFTGLTPEQCDKLMKEQSLYLTRNGRISIAGLNTGNIKRVAQAIHNVTK